MTNETDPQIDRQMPTSDRSALEGSAWMVAACLCLGSLNVLVRHVSAELHPFQIAFFRNLGQFVLMLPWLAVAGLAVMRTQRLKVHAVRSAVGLAAMLTWFSALALLPVADATALNFTAPLFATMGAALFLGETVRARRWTATAVGFFGALVIVRPGFAEIDPAMGLAVLAAAFMAAAALFTKSLSGTENPNAMVLYMGGFMTLYSFPFALYDWRSPDAETWAWLAVMGVVATAAHLAVNRAFRAAEASAVMPLDFVRLPASALLAFLAFGEVPDLWVWIGGGIIFASSTYIARREAKLNKRVTQISGPINQAVRECERPS